MGNKKKAAATFIRLVSTAGTGFFYVKRKPTKMTEKLEFRKYDPRVNRHVLFKEAKMKWEVSHVVGLCIPYTLLDQCSVFVFVLVDNLWINVNQIIITIISDANLQ